MMDGPPGTSFLLPLGAHRLSRAVALTTPPSLPQDLPGERAAAPGVRVKE